jgi:hypothetical protein
MFKIHTKRLYMPEKKQFPTITLELDQETYDALVDLAARDEISVEDCAYNLFYEGLAAELEEEVWEDEEEEDEEPEHRDPWGKGT